MGGRARAAVVIGLAFVLSACTVEYVPIETADRGQAPPQGPDFVPPDAPFEGGAGIVVGRGRFGNESWTVTGTTDGGRDVCVMVEIETPTGGFGSGGCDRPGASVVGEQAHRLGDDGPWLVVGTVPHSATEVAFVSDAGDAEAQLVSIEGRGRVFVTQLPADATTVDVAAYDDAGDEVAALDAWELVDESGFDTGSRPDAGDEDSPPPLG